MLPLKKSGINRTERPAIQSQTPFFSSVSIVDRPSRGVIAFTCQFKLHKLINWPSSRVEKTREVEHLQDKILEVAAIMND